MSYLPHVAQRGSFTGACWTEEGAGQSLSPSPLSVFVLLCPLQLSTFERLLLSAEYWALQKTRNKTELGKEGSLPGGKVFVFVYTWQWHTFFLPSCCCHSGRHSQIVAAENLRKGSSPSEIGNIYPCNSQTHFIFLTKVCLFKVLFFCLTVKVSYSPSESQSHVYCPFCHMWGTYRKCWG